MDLVLESSIATPEFKTAIGAFLSGERTDRVKVDGYAPRVKVRRVLTQLLTSEPQLDVDQVVIRGTSGCSDFVGSVAVETRSGTTHVYDFVWCCRWRAENEGYTDYFGFPDQLRAAQEFDWRCFRQWERRED